MRITLRIDDDLHRELKERARCENITLAALVERVLRQGLSMATDEVHRTPFRQKTFSMGAPMVDLTKALALAAELEDQEIIKKLELGK